VGQLIHVDLMFLNSPRNTAQNIVIDDYRYLLIAVDTYSRFLMIYLLKSKEREEVTQKIEEMIKFIKDSYLNGDPFNRMYINILSDKGGEFKNIKLEENI